MVRGDKGRVPMRTELIMRFDYGRGIPWVRQHSAARRPSRARTRCSSSPRSICAARRADDGRRVHGHGRRHRAVHDELVPSHHRASPTAIRRALLSSETSGTTGRANCTLQGQWREAIIRSLINAAGC
jgi:hypothetical protein